MPDLKPANAVKDLAPKTLMLYALAKAIPGVLMLASVPIWIRLYGSANYGTFAVVWGAVLFSSALGTGWIRQSTLKFAGSARNRLSNIAPVWICLSVLASALLPAMVVWILRDVHTTESTVLLTGASVAFATASAVYYVALVVAQRDQRAISFILAEGLRAAATLAASLLLPILLGNYSGTTLVLANAVGTVIGGSLLIPRRAFPFRKSISSRAVLHEFWDFGWPMGLWQAVAAATLYMDRFFITLLIGSTAAGTYAALADILVRGFTLLSYPILVAGHPTIMRAWNTGYRDRAVELSRLWTARLAFIIFGGVGLSVIACLALGEWLLGFRVNNSPTLWLLAIGAGCWQLSLMTHKGLEMVSRPRLMLLCLAGLVAATVPLNVVLIPIWGSAVAAATFAFASSAYCLITYLLSNRMLRSYQSLEIHP